MAVRRVYFDHNATTPVDREVLEAMLPFFADEFGNASSIHSFGQPARAAVESARAQLVAQQAAVDNAKVALSSDYRAQHETIEIHTAVPVPIRSTRYPPRSLSMT